jgi:VWFA-related protein
MQVSRTVGAKIALIAISLSAGVLLANAQGQVENAAPSSAQPVPVLRTSSFTVVLDVVVTDSNVAVHEIDQKRFHVYENGREQAVTYFEEHKPDSAASTAKRRTMPPHYYNNLPAHPPGGAVNVLLLDGLNTPVSNQVEVRKQMLAYVKTVPPGTTMAVFTLASRLRMIQGFTSSVADLTAALEKAQSAPQQSVALDSSAGNAFDSAIGNLTMMKAPADEMASIQQFQSDVDAHRTDNRVAITLEALQALARYLNAVPGRKNLIWFSASFPIAVGPDPGDQSLQNSRSYADQVRTTSDLLSTARVAVYPIDARGLMELPGFDSSDNGLNVVPGASSGAPRFARQNSQQMSAETNSHFAMEQIARDTGGLALFNTNGFKAAVATAIANGESYYTLAYTPDAKNFNGDFRKLKVKVDDSRYDLEYRSGYFADAPGAKTSQGVAPTSLMTTATLHGAPLSTQVLFQSRVLPASDPEFKGTPLPPGPAGDMAATMKAPTQAYIVDLAVDPRTLVFESGADGTHKMSLEFALVAYDADGKRVNFVDRKVDLALKDDQFAQLAKSGIPVRMAIDLPLGNNSLRIAVHDVGGVRVGSLEIPLTVGSS